MRGSGEAESGEGRKGGEGGRPSLTRLRAEAVGAEAFKARAAGNDATATPVSSTTTRSSLVGRSQSMLRQCSDSSQTVLRLRAIPPRVLRSLWPTTPTSAPPLSSPPLSHCVVSFCPRLSFLYCPR